MLREDVPLSERHRLVLLLDGVEFYVRLLDTSGERSTFLTEALPIGRDWLQELVKPKPLLTPRFGPLRIVTNGHTVEVELTYRSFWGSRQRFDMAVLALLGAWSVQYRRQML